MRPSSLYIHFPYCVKKCCYCDFFSLPQRDSFENYHSYLYRSLKEHQNILNNFNTTMSPLESLYIGGGTPSLWRKGPEFMRNFLQEQASENHFRLAKNCEWTVEINPGAVHNENIFKWFDCGANRFSVGIQSLNNDLLTQLGRIHSVDDVYSLLTVFKNNKWNYSVDLLLGLPDKKRCIIDEIKRIMDFYPNHFSVYILTLAPNHPWHAFLPEDEYIREEYLKVSDFFKSQGFSHYEVSNFARESFTSKHNLKYWNGHSVSALGPNASGLLVLDNGEAYRYKWDKNTYPDEIKYWHESLSIEEFELEKLYMGLRATGICCSDFSFPASVWDGLIAKWKKDNYIESVHPVLKLNSLGYLMLDSLMDDIFHASANESLH